VCGAVAWSPDGQWLTLERARYKRDVPTFSLAVYTTRGHRPRPVQAIADAGFHAWSPDSHRIAFIRGFARGGVLWVVDPRDGNQRRLALALEFDWSPSGTQLVVAHPRERRSFGRGPVVIWVVDAESGQNRKVWPKDASACGCGDPAWQPA
jgi:Tol biopolymer transport system component